MLRPLQEQEFDHYVDFAYALALDLAKSAYPTYCDGIKTRADFIQQAKRAFGREHEEILLFEHDGSIEGWIHYYALPEDRYVSFCAFNVRQCAAAAVDEVIAYLAQKYSGCDLYFGLPAQNEAVISRLESLRFVKEDENYVDVLHFEDHHASEPVSGVIRVTKENFGAFAELHKVHDEDMYWNNPRLLAAIEDWNIYLLYENGSAVGAIYFCCINGTMMEIFGIDYAGDRFSSGVFRKLLTHALNEGKAAGMRHLVFFTGEEDHPTAARIGFKLVSRYVLYSKRI